MALNVIFAEYRLGMGKLKQDAAQVSSIVKKTGDDVEKSSNRSQTAINKTTREIRGMGMEAQKAGDRVAAGFNKVAASQKSIGGELRKIQSNFSGMSAGLSQLAGAMGVAFGVQQVVAFGKASVDAFIDAEKNAQLLLFALKGNEAAQNRLMAQASRIQENTIFDDDSVQQAQTFLATQGRTEEQIQKVIDAAVELSTVTGVDLQTAVMQLDGTFEGNIGKLAKLDSAFKKLTPEQLANGAAADLLIEKYGGVAKAMGDTTAGQVAKLKNELGELQETVGGELVPVLTAFAEGLNKLSSGEIFNGLDSIGGAFEKMTTIAQLFGPIAGVTDAFKSLKGALKDFRDGDILGGIAQGYEAIANSISFGLYDAIKDELVPGVKESKDALTDFEKQQFAVIVATKAQIETERERIKAIGGSVEAFDKWVADVQQAEITKTFEQLNQVLEITEKQYERLTDISDKYNASARISSDLILDIRTATEQDLEVAFQKFNSTLGVTRKDFDDYIGQVKELKPLQEDLAKSTTAVVGPWDKLNQTISKVNKGIYDYLTLGEDAMLQDRERFELQKKINKVQEEYNYLLGLHNPIAKDNAEINKASAESLTGLGEAAFKTLEPTRELPFNLQAITDASKDNLKSIEELIAEYEDVARIAGALAELGESLNNALTQIFGEAAEKNAVFAAFQKAITISTITFKSIEAVANGVAAFSSGVAGGDPVKIISGIASIIAGVGNLIGGLIQQVQATQVPSAPSFHKGTDYVQRGNNPKGIDTIPAYLNEGEGVVTTPKNAMYPGLVKSINEGNFEEYALSFAAPFFQNQDTVGLPIPIYDDTKMLKSSKGTNALLKQQNILLTKHLNRKNNPWSC